MVELLHMLSLAGVVVLFYPLLLELVPASAQLTKRAPERWQADTLGRIRFFDSVRGIAIVAVVIIHVTLFLGESGAGVSQLVLDMVNNLLRFAVPIFFICSGILLTPVSPGLHSLSQFFVSVLRRILLPYVAFVVLLGVAGLYEWPTFLYVLVTGEVLLPLYFVVVLLQLYLLYPVIEPLAHYRWFVWLTLGVSLFAAVAKFGALFGVPLFVPYLFFFAWGIYMRDGVLERTFGVVYWPWVLILLLYVGIFSLSGVDRFYNSRFFYGPAVFVLLYVLYQHDYFKILCERCFSYIGRHSLWIFMTHYVVLEYLFSLSVSGILFQSIAGVVLISLIAVVTSVAVGLLATLLWSTLERFCKNFLVCHR